MKHAKTLLAALAGAGLIFSAIGNAQEFIQVAPGELKIDTIEIEAQKTPDFEVSGVSDKKIDRPREWLELEMKFEPDVRRAPKGAVLNELLFRFYVGIVDEKTRQPVVLTGDVIHTNVVVGEPSFSAMYVPPATMGKLTGDYRSADTGAVKAYGAEVLYNGQLVGLWSSTGSGTKGRFWDGKQTSPGILSRDKTPFGILWIDRYPEIKQSRN